MESFDDGVMTMKMLLEGENINQLLINMNYFWFIKLDKFQWVK